MGLHVFASNTVNAGDLGLNCARPSLFLQKSPGHLFKFIYNQDFFDELLYHMN